VDYEDWLIMKEQSEKSKCCINDNCCGVMRLALDGKVRSYICVDCGLEAYINRETGEVKTLRWSSVKNTDW